MNRREKFDAASFILGGEIRNRTKLQTNTKNEHKQTVNDISTPCLTAFVDNKKYIHKERYMDIFASNSQ